RASGRAPECHLYRQIIVPGPRATVDAKARTPARARANTAISADSGRSALSPQPPADFERSRVEVRQRRIRIRRKARRRHEFVRPRRPAAPDEAAPAAVEPLQRGAIV